MIKKTGILLVTIIIITLAIKLNINAGIIALGNTGDDNKENIKVDNNNSARERLTKLENLNTNEIEEKIKNANKTTETKENKDILNENGKIDYKKYFKNTVFFGDSITEFISAAQILNDKSVVATKGRNVISAKQDVDKIVQLNPDRIFILFGMNDVGIFSNTDDFKKKYIELIEQIKTSLPKTEIYIESPLPVQSKASKGNPRLTNDNITKFRQAVQEVASTEGVKYVDITSLVADEKYFEQDGIHFVYNFYPELFNYLINTIETNKVG